MNGPLAPAEVEYQFRDMRSQLGCARNRLNSLVRNFANDPQILAKLREVSDLMVTLDSRVFVAQEQALTKSFPHRRNAGEHEHW